MTDDLVTRARQYDGQSFETTACYNGLRDELAARIEADTATIARLEGERERLALAICGGEDAPGYANAQTVETLEHVAKQNQQSHGATINSLLAAEAERDRLQSALRHIVTYLAAPTVASEDTLNSLRGDLRFVGRVASAALKGESHE